MLCLHLAWKKLQVEITQFQATANKNNLVLIVRWIELQLINIICKFMKFLLEL